MLIEMADIDDEKRWNWTNWRGRTATSLKVPLNARLGRRRETRA